MRSGVNKVPTKTKKSRKIKRETRQLFAELKKQASIHNLSKSVIILDDTTDQTIHNKTIENKPIVIDDEPSMFTSTPKKVNTIDQLILNASNQFLNETNNNRTKIINDSSYQTVDLTTDALDNDCFVTSVSSINSLSQGSTMSGDSEVTVLRRPEPRKSFTPAQLMNAIKNLDSSNKDKILVCLAEQLMGSKELPRAKETPEDTYIKEVIVAKKLSRNSIGSNVYNPDARANTSGLRMVVVDGSNVAMAHGNNTVFSVRGLEIVIDYFRRRGHVVKAFVPQFRCKNGKSSDPQLLMRLERQNLVTFTPSREVRGQFMVPYDDRYIIQCAVAFKGIVVSNDKYSDLLREDPRWEEVISKRVLPFTWCNGMVMFPRDPMGRNGPTLENFLKMPANN